MVRSQIHQVVRQTDNSSLFCMANEKTRRSSKSADHSYKCTLSKLIQPFGFCQLKGKIDSISSSASSFPYNHLHTDATITAPSVPSNIYYITFSMSEARGWKYPIVALKSIFHFNISVCTTSGATVLIQIDYVQLCFISFSLLLQGNKSWYHDIVTCEVKQWSKTTARKQSADDVIMFWLAACDVINSPVTDLSDRAFVLSLLFVVIHVTLY